MKKIIPILFVICLIYVACTKEKIVYKDRSSEIVDNIKLSYFKGEKRNATLANVQFNWSDSVNNLWSYNIVDSINSTILFSDSTNISGSDTINNVSLGRKYIVEIRGISHINLSDTTRYKDNLRFKFFIGTMGDVQISY